MISNSLLPEFDQEMGGTRKALERVPESKFDFKPHEKSMSLAQLASHLAELTSWTVPTLKQPSLDIAPPGGPAYEPYVASSSSELLSRFDKNVAEARAALASCEDPEMMQNWSLLMGGNALFTMPRVAVFRGMIMNHVIHHRGQLTVYLRLIGVPVPALYGPSADEGQM
jgi:uncharacterized damage-inducible protein DinB